jgi:hypothetical protein
VNSAERVHEMVAPVVLEPEAPLPDDGIDRFSALQGEQPLLEVEPDLG